jgi:hypothetical protein
MCGCQSGPPPSALHQEQPAHRAEENRRSDRYDLQRDEERGGHTLRKHVGRTDAELQDTDAHYQYILSQIVLAYEMGLTR